MGIADFHFFAILNIFNYQLKYIFWDIFPLYKPFLDKAGIYVIDTLQMSSAMKYNINTYKNGSYAIIRFNIYGSQVTTKTKCYFSPVLDVV